MSRFSTSAVTSGSVKVVERGGIKNGRIRRICKMHLTQHEAVKVYLFSEKIYLVSHLPGLAFFFYISAKQPVF